MLLAHKQKDPFLHLYSGEETGPAVVVKLLAEFVENGVGWG